MTKHTYLIDSSIWIRIIRRTPNPNLSARLDQLVAEGIAATNPLIKLEVMSGAPNEARFEQYGRTLGALVQLPIDDFIWMRAGRLGYDLRRAGVPVTAPDLIISACAIAHAAIVVHADADFDRIARHSDLRVESYAASSV